MSERIYEDESSVAFRDEPQPGVERTRVEWKPGTPGFLRSYYEQRADAVIAGLDDLDTRFATLTAEEKDAALQLLLKAVKVLALHALGRLDT